MGHLAAAGGLIERAVSEAIDAVAAPSLRAEVIRLALAWARRADIPERGPDAGDFVRGPLYHAAQEVLGPQLAASIRDELMPVTDMVADEEISEVRPSTPVRGYAPLPEAPARVADGDDAFPVLEVTEAEGDDFPVLEIAEADDDDFPVLELASDVPTEDVLHPFDGDGEEAPDSGRRPMQLTDPAPGRMRKLLVASRDPEALSELSRALVGVAALQPVADALAILEQLGPEDVMLVDCGRPTVRLETLLAMAPEIPAGARIVLWRERPDLEQQLSALGDGLPGDWICCGDHATSEDAAAVCRVLFH
ncbi:MAG TPA: hypothetical protein RMH99_12565 [Sandaracinaceae bacterium LLY-WYZ-13_1]|nr:hypothetical protein [Sandaracinaceae bacterium LLY-WYZ-13_1]